MDVVPSWPGCGRRLGEHRIEQPGFGGDEDIGDEFGVAGGAGQRDGIEVFEKIESLLFGAFADQPVEQVQRDPRRAGDVLVGIGRSREQRVAGEIALGFRDAEMGGRKMLGLESGRTFKVDASGLVVAQFLLCDSEIVKRPNEAGMIRAQGGPQQFQGFFERGLGIGWGVLAERDRPKVIQIGNGLQRGGGEKPPRLLGGGLGPGAGFSGFPEAELAEGDLAVQ